MPQQKLYPLQIATALPAELMGWSAASTRLHLEYKRCTEEVFPCKYTDLGNAGFHLVGLNLRGEAVVRRKCSGTQLLQLTANSQVDLIGMEACAGAHFLGRAVREQRPETRIISAQYVKPYVKTNKSDYVDAEAIAEAARRPPMRFVPIKTAINWTCSRCTSYRTMFFAKKHSENRHALCCLECGLESEFDPSSKNSIGHPLHVLLEHSCKKGD